MEHSVTSTPETLSNWPSARLFGLGLALTTAFTLGQAVADPRPPQAEFPAPVYVTLKGDAAVEVLPDDIRWPGGPHMLYDAITPDGTKVLATSPSTNSLYVFAIANGERLAVIPVGKDPKGVKVSPDGRLAYVSNQGSANLSVVDLATLKVIQEIPTEPAPHNARFTSDGKTAYVTLQGGAGLGVVDTAKGEMVRVIPLPGLTGPHNLDLSPDDRTAYVRDFVHHVAVVDLSSGEVTRVITVGKGHGGIDVTPDGRYAATTGIAGDTLSLIDTRTLEVTTIQVGKAPHGVRASRDGRWLYVSLTGEQAVAVIDLQTQKLTKKIPVGRIPFWVAVLGNP